MLMIRTCKLSSYRDGRLDRRVRMVIHDRDVFVGVVEDRITWRENEFRIRPGLTTELQGHLLDVVVVDVAVPAGPDELADLQAGLRGHHVRQQRVARDVERHPEKQ